MKALVVELIAWIAAHSGLAPVGPPHVVAVPVEELVERFCGAPVPADDVTIEALYDRDSATVYVTEGWNRADVVDRSKLLHELVHHVHIRNRVEAHCAAALEPLAYELQFAWLQENGVDDPYKALNTDAFTVRLNSACPD